MTRNGKPMRWSSKDSRLRKAKTNASLKQTLFKKIINNQKVFEGKNFTFSIYSAFQIQKTNKILHSQMFGRVL